ncbi:MAG: aspartate kinase [Lentisphaeria bacterium]|nr:aspartate kinase [Lentisphaeria bacterium]
MAGVHTVEKIGGTSMSRFGEIMENVIIGRRPAAEMYNRVFIVSAYGGITNLLLEDKKTGSPGVYARFAAGDPDWQEALEEVRSRMIALNRTFASIGLDQEAADQFVNERLDGVWDCLNDLMRLRSYGHFHPRHYLPPSRELLSAVGEAHSAHNSVLVLRRHGVNARLVDLTGWRDTDITTMDEAIRQGFAGVDVATEMPIVTGYVKYDEGIMSRYDRGYSEITFSKVAVLTEAREGIIHKEYHLSTGDPVLIGADKVKVIGHTNFDIADQLSDLDMEAIHSRASKEMELRNIPIRVKNAFDPEHPGTLIQRDYVSPAPRVEIICGRNDLIAIECYDPEMVGKVGYDHELTKALTDTGISFIAKNTNANTIAHIVPEKSKRLDDCVEIMHQRFPGAQVSVQPVGILSVIGSNMRIPGLLYRAAKALAEAGINVLALDQCLRQVNMQFIIERQDFAGGIRALHREFVED